MPTSRFARTYIDYSAEKSTMDFRIRDMTAASIADILTDAATLGTAIDGLTLGNLVKSQLMQDSSGFSATPPGDENAQRERKWLFRYQDTVTQGIYQVEIPIAATRGAGNALLLLPGTDKANFAAAEWAAFVAAFEDLGRSPAGNPVVALDAYLVGRNL